MFDVKSFEKVCNSLFKDITPANMIPGDKRFYNHLGLNKNIRNFIDYGMPEVKARPSKKSYKEPKYEEPNDEEEEENENRKLRAGKKKKEPVEEEEVDIKREEPQKNESDLKIEEQKDESDLKKEEQPKEEIRLLDDILKANEETKPVEEPKQEESKPVETFKPDSTPMEREEPKPVEEPKKLEEFAPVETSKPVETPMEKEEPKPLVEKIIEKPKSKWEDKKFKIEPNGSIVKVPEGYGTDDPLERDVIKILNDNTLPWRIGKQGKNIKISIRNVNGPGGLMVKNECTFPYPMDKVVTSITDLPTEKKWHEGAAKSETLEPGVDKDNWNKDIRYSYSKFPFPLADRDWLTKRRWTKTFADDPKQAMILTTSCQHKKYPPQDRPVRAEIYIQGHHFQDLGNGTCKLTMISQADVKISGFQGMAEKKMPEGQYKFFEAWLEGLKKLK